MIKEFQGEYRFLSNFYPLETNIPDGLGLSYPTIEHFYVASKTNDRKFKEEISKIPAERAGYAKRLGKSVQLSIPNWDGYKNIIMYHGLVWKFSSYNPNLRQMLIDTGDQEIYEGNRWGDTYWGVDIETMKGKNTLGELIMKVRNEIFMEQF